MKNSEIENMLEYIDIKRDCVKKGVESIGSSENALDEVKKIGVVADEMSKFARAVLYFSKNYEEELKNNLSKKKFKNLKKDEKELEEIQDVFAKIAKHFENFKH